MAQGNIEVTITCLQHAIEDTQATIRAYDAKAEVLGILLTLALGISNYTLALDQIKDCAKWLLILSWFFGLVSMVLLGAVLYPKKNIFAPINMGGYIPTRTYFWINDPNRSVVDLADLALGTNWCSELVFENLKLSLIRDTKHSRFIRSLWAALLVIVCILFAVISKAKGW